MIENTLPESDPQDPSLVVEVMPPGYDVWVPQYVNVQGVQRIAACKASMGDLVKTRLESVFGVDRVRLVPVEGYQPDARAEGVRQTLQMQSLVAPDAQSGDVSKLHPIGLNGAIITLFLESTIDHREFVLNIVISPAGKVVVCPAGPDGEILENVRLWEGRADDPTLNPLRMSWNLAFQWLTTVMPAMDEQIKALLQSQQQAAFDPGKAS